MALGPCSEKAANSSGQGVSEVSEGVLASFGSQGLNEKRGLPYGVLCLIFWS